jgi:hypothetical protein
MTPTTTTARTVRLLDALTPGDCDWCDHPIEPGQPIAILDGDTYVHATHRRYAACGHPRTPDNTVPNSRGGHRCRTCRDAANRRYRQAHPTPLARCNSCNDGACEPTTCGCDDPRPDGLGECARCRRLVLACSWHEGRPTEIDLGGAA